MRLLLDTHALIWWSLENPRLTKSAREAILVSSEVYLSVASIWEMAIKVRSGKLPEVEPFLQSVRVGQGIPGISLLQITPTHAIHAGLMGISHRDPFDRLLIA